MLALLAAVAAPCLPPVAAPPAALPLAPVAHGAAYPPPPPPAGGDPPPGGGGGGGGADPPSGGGGGGGGGGVPTPPSPGSPAPGLPPRDKPSSPGPAGPAAPPAGPGTPAGPGPQSPTPTGPSSPGGSAQPAVDGLNWSHWWNLERDLYLELRDRIRATNTVAAGQSAVLSSAGIPPSRATIDDTVLPLLLDALATERADDLLTASLIAVGRIGDGGDAALGRRLAMALEMHLGHRSQEVSETAALSLGILANDASVPTLVELLRASDRGADLVKRGAVPVRTRAFAAFGLGLLAHSNEDNALRQRIALELVAAIDETHVRSDVPIAAVIALGLCPLSDRPVVPAAAMRSRDGVEVVLSRASQLGWLADRIEDGDDENAKRFVAIRAHACVALARLGATASEAARDRVVEVLAGVREDRSEPASVRTGALVALGELVRSGASPSDRLGRRAIENALAKGQPMERRFATIALAASSARPGADDDPLAAAETSRRALLQQLARGKSADRPWAALALGVQAHALRAAGAADSDKAGAVLLDRLRAQRNASDVGAFAIGCALTCEESPRKLRERAGDAAHEAFGRLHDPVSRGHLAISLGLLGHEAARDDLRATLDDAGFQPALLWSSAVGLGLLGDKELTPLLVKALVEAQSHSSRAAAAAALGNIGDRRAVPPLIDVVRDDGRPAATRAFAVIGLGVVCDPAPMPWRTPIAHAMPYFALTETLSGGTRGLLEIL